MRMPDYIKSGEGPITLFLFHGAYGSKGYWTYLTEFFVTRGYRVIAWDAPGYGLSPLSPDHSIPFMAEAGAYMVKELGTEKNILLGHSMGAMTAPLIAKLAHGHVDGVILSSGVASPDGGTPEWKKNFLEKMVPSLVAMINQQDNPALLAMFAPGSKGPAMDLVKKISTQTRGDTFQRSIATGSEYDGTAAAKALDVPTLCLCGRVDPLAKPEMVKEMADIIPGSEMHIFESAGHYSFGEVPDEFHAVVYDFLCRNGLTPN